MAAPSASASKRVEAWGHCVVCVCACVWRGVCFDEFITKLKGLMRHAQGQRQKEVPALAQSSSE